MLIAIMHETFTKVNHNEHQSAMKEKINILSDFRLVLEMLGVERNFQYIFVLRPSIYIGEDNSLESKLAEIQQSFDYQSNKIISD